MSHITKIAAVETMMAIWEYDPQLSANRILSGSLDVIAAVRTLAIKVSFFNQLSPVDSHINQIQSSGQHIEDFERLQIKCGITQLLKIPLHSNVQWGSAYQMLNHCIAGYLLWVEMGGIYASEWVRELWRTKGVWLLIDSINVLACIFWFHISILLRTIIWRLTGITPVNSCC